MATEYPARSGEGARVYEVTMMVPVRAKVRARDCAGARHVAMELVQQGQIAVEFERSERLPFVIEVARARLVRG